MSKKEIDCSNCGPLRNTPSCYATCEYYRRQKEKNAAIKKALSPAPADQYNIDGVRKHADRNAKKKRK